MAVEAAAEVAMPAAEAVIRGNGAIVTFGQRTGVQGRTRRFAAGYGRRCPPWYRSADC
jgi:hypothetical protein